MISSTAGAKYLKLPAAVFTLFALPKAFIGHTAIIQRNALGSWVRLRPAPEVVLFGDDPGVAEAAREFGVRHIPAIARNEFGTPLVSDLFQKAEAASVHDVLCYTNADIIFMNDLPAAVARVAQGQRRFLLGGKRWNLDLRTPLGFDDGWDERLRAHSRAQGVLQDAWWIDYFVFRRGIAAAMPPFAIGRPAWDNWLIYHARRQRIPVIDATEVVAAIHQAHDYAHVPQSTGDHWRGPESDRNIALAGGHERAFSLLDASHRLTHRGIRRRVSLQPLRRRLDSLGMSGRGMARLAGALRLARRLVSSAWHS
jgi:hypothetical protein